MGTSKFKSHLSRDREGWDGIECIKFCSIGSVAGAVIGGVISSKSAKKANATNERAIDASSAIADKQFALALKQDARADEQWARYQQVYAPAEEQMLDESRGMGSAANQNKAAGDAAAGVVSGFARARERLTKNPGVNPSSQQHQQEMSKISLAEAATSAAAQTSAREAVKDRATASMTNAVSLGKGLPASATAGSNSAGMIAGSASGIYGSIAAGARQQSVDAGNNAYGIGKAVGGVMQSAPVQKWMNGGAQASFSNTSMGSSGFGTGKAYGNQDLGDFL